MATTRSVAIVATERADTLAAVVALGAAPAQVALVSTEAKDVLSAGAGVVLSALLAGSEAKDTLATAVAVKLALAFAASEARDTLSAATTVGAALSAALAYQEAADNMLALAYGEGAIADPSQSERTHQKSRRARSS